MEVVIQGASQPGADETFTAVNDGWLRKVGVNNRIAVDALLGELDLGESETIVLARQLSDFLSWEKHRLVRRLKWPAWTG